MVLLQNKGVRFLALFLILHGTVTYAQEKKSVTEFFFSANTAYYFPDHGSYNLEGNFAPINYSVINGSGDNRDIGSSWGGAEAIAEFKMVNSRPFLVGDNFLTSGNHLTTTSKFQLSPVSMGITFEALLSPIAVLDLFVGSSVDTGWTAIGVTGLGLHENKVANNNAFQGAMWQGWLGGTFKFDFAAVLPGDPTWKHIVVLSSHRIHTRQFTAAKNSDTWVFQGVDGYNGIQYKHTSVLAYQMPLVLDMAGFLVETSTDTSNHFNYGTNYVGVRFGGLFNFKFNNNHSLAILPQFTTKPRFTNDTVLNKYFLDRTINPVNTYIFDFDRIALSYTAKF
jgi:hypothetical protein